MFPILFFFILLNNLKDLAAVSEWEWNKKNEMMLARLAEMRQVRAEWDAK